MKIDAKTMFKCPFCYAWNPRPKSRTCHCDDCGKDFQPISIKKRRKVKLQSDMFKIASESNHPFLPVRHGFAHESFRHPELAKLRKKYDTASIIKPYTDEFTQQLAMCEWICAAFTAGQPSVPSVSKNGPDPDYQIETILRKARKRGNTYFCTYKALASVQFASAFGWTARLLNIDGYNGPFGRVSAGHMVYEIWSNQFNKWYFCDSLFNIHVMKGDVPLSAHEIREDFFKNLGRDLTYEWGAGRFRLPDEMKVHRGAWKCEWYVIYMHNNFFDFVPGDHIHPLLAPRDRHNRRKKWRRQPANTGNVYFSKGMVIEESDPYYLNYPLNQTEIMLVNQEDHLLVRFNHNMPNYQHLEMRLNGRGKWQRFDDHQRAINYRWYPTGTNSLLEARCVNTMNVAGPVSTVKLGRA